MHSDVFIAIKNFLHKVICESYDTMCFNKLTSPKPTYCGMHSGALNQSVQQSKIALSKPGIVDYLSLPSWELAFIRHLQLEGTLHVSCLILHSTRQLLSIQLHEKLKVHRYCNSSVTKASVMIEASEFRSPERIWNLDGCYNLSIIPIHQRQRQGISCGQHKPASLTNQKSGRPWPNV